MLRSSVDHVQYIHWTFKFGQTVLHITFIPKTKQDASKLRKQSAGQKLLAVREELAKVYTKKTGIKLENVDSKGTYKILLYTDGYFFWTFYDSYNIFTKNKSSKP